MKRRVWIAISCIALVAAIYLTIHYSRPKHIEISIDSTIYSPGTEFEKQTTVSIIGDQHNRLFGKDSLTGKLIVDHDLIYEINLKRDEDRLFQILTKIEDGNQRLQSVGSVMASINLERIWLQLDDINVRYELNEGYISGPAKDREEANIVARSIAE